MFTMRNFFNKQDYIYLILLALMTAIASEIKVIPFNGEAIRFGLGSVVFFLLILIRQPVYLVRAGLITGVTVVCFRLFIDITFYHVDYLSGLIHHLPAALFYFIFALGLHIIHLETYKQTPLLLGALAAGLELIGNSAEHLVRLLLIGGATFSFKEWTLLAGVAFIRSYFVVGLFSSIMVSEQKKQIRDMLSVGTELYAETLYLQKSMNHMEQITASSHELYRKLKKENLNELSVQALHIAQEIHEVKKDSQRIYSGLSKMTKQRKDDIYLLSELLGFVITANEKYSELLKKEIVFDLSLSVDFETEEHIPLLAVVNNITANAVESIANSGEVKLRIFEELEYTCMEITDSGQGILEDEVDVIFEPGYTTKFSDLGVAAIGIGLSHVKEIIHALEGDIQVVTPRVGSIFTIRIPTSNIQRVRERK